MKSKVDPALWRRFNTRPMRVRQLARNLARFLLIGPMYPRGAAGPLRQIAFRSCRGFDDVSAELGRVDTLHVGRDAGQEPAFGTVWARLQGRPSRLWSRIRHLHLTRLLSVRA
ncbi:MAG: hypothetical protein BWX68_02342 [Verrucomicrobia bacterium ADurb.Bin063]|jgi:hypothetical protein|nr:MAG: hypothetical protein BWX68_02342 [Verrucomicrobia bacterium ADurb.Bin063]